MARSSTTTARSGKAIPKGRRVRRRTVSPARKISRVLFTTYASALLLYPVYLSSGTPRVAGVCEVYAPAEMWAQVAFSHPVGIYGLLATVGAGMFLRPKILQAAFLSALVAGGVELVEFAFNAGTCSIRELLPAFIGIAMAVGIHTVMRAATPPPPVRRVKRLRKPKKAKRSWVAL